jgi:cytochrome P450
VSCPVHYDDELEMWVVSDPHQVRTVFGDPVTYSPSNALTAHTPLTTESLRVLVDAGFALPPTLASNSDPASHRPLRRSLARFFGPAKVARAEPLTRELVRDRLSALAPELAAGRSVDLLAAVGEVPTLVLLDVVGIEPADGDGANDLPRWSRDSLELFWGRPDPVRQRALARSAAEYYTWLRRRITAARSRPSRNLFGRLVALGLSDAQACSTAYFLLVAGQETTRQLIGAAFEGLLTEPASWRSIAGNAPMAAAAIEEVLRERSPVHTWRRTTTVDTDLGAAHLAAGAPILLKLTGTGGSADLAFGLGIHRCLGAGLARMEGQIALEEATRALPDAVLAEPDPPQLDLLSFQAPNRILIEAG